MVKLERIRIWVQEVFILHPKTTPCDFSKIREGLRSGPESAVPRTEWPSFFRTCIFRSLVIRLIQIDLMPFGKHQIIIGQRLADRTWTWRWWNCSHLSPNFFRNPRVKPRSSISHPPSGANPPVYFKELWIKRLVNGKKYIIFLNTPRWLCRVSLMKLRVFITWGVVHLLLCSLLCSLQFPLPETFHRCRWQKTLSETCTCDLTELPGVLRFFFGQPFPSWWFQPIWKYWSNWIHFPKDRGEYLKKYLKPPTSFFSLLFWMTTQLQLSGFLSRWKSSKNRGSNIVLGCKLFFQIIWSWATAQTVERCRISHEQKPFMPSCSCAV